MAIQVSKDIQAGNTMGLNNADNGEVIKQIRDIVTHIKDNNKVLFSDTNLPFRRNLTNIQASSHTSYKITRIIKREIVAADSSSLLVPALGWF